MTSSVVEFAKRKAFRAADRLSDRFIRKIEMVEERIESFEKKIFFKIVFAFLIVLAIVFILISGYFLLTEFALLSKTLSAFLVGIFVLIVALLLYLIIRGGKEW